MHSSTVIRVINISISISLIFAHLMVKPLEDQAWDIVMKKLLSLDPDHRPDGDAVVELLNPTPSS